MNSKLFTAIILLMTALTLSCSNDNKIKPSSTITTVEYNVSGFNQLMVEDAFNVEIEISSDTEQILVEANENLQSHIFIEKNLNELIIKMDDKITTEGTEPTLNVYITTDHIFAFRASGASKIELMDTLTADMFEINLSGASYFTGPLMGGDINTSLSGASGIFLAGNASKFNVNGTGASTVEGFDFVADWLHADITGACIVSQTVNNKLDVWASGASTVYYKGDGIVYTQDLSGGSTIIKVE